MILRAQDNHIVVIPNHGAKTRRCRLSQHLVTELCIIPKSMYVAMTSLPSAVLGRHMMVVSARKGEHYFQELPKHIESQVNGMLFLFRDSEL